MRIFNLVIKIDWMRREGRIPSICLETEQSLGDGVLETFSRPYHENVEPSLFRFCQDTRLQTSLSHLETYNLIRCLVRARKATSLSNLSRSLPLLNRHRFFCVLRGQAANIQRNFRSRKEGRPLYNENGRKLYPHSDSAGLMG